MGAILVVDARKPGLLELLHGIVDINGIAVSGVGVRRQRNVDDGCEALAVRDVFVQSHDADIIWLVGAILLEQNDEWAVQRARYMTLETIAPLSDNPIVGLPAVAT